ncbi:MAG TPA: SUMF1/EgtB/PvdO family nonheme iron enzyme, partial [Luteolibacter sp.]|nr:SUMF1/EgtB/PvdO family nonheme iron enzyme [Luteolibacter sp.]
ADGAITIPAAAYSKKEEKNEDKEEDGPNDVITMQSHGGGLQVFLPTFVQQKPILVRGGTYKHEADLCESATRHWRGRRPKTSAHMRGLRLALTPDEGPIQKEFKLQLGEDMHIEFVYIPPGKFIMGGTREQKAGDILADTPKHEVTLTKGFYLAKTELTQAQYGYLMNKDFGKSAKSPEHPMEGIKPSFAVRLCEELSGKVGLEVRVPTEAEWEYAARAGTSTRWSFGDDASQLGDYAWFKDNAGGASHPVGQKKPNPWGLYDMYGNVAEMVRDDHREDYYAVGPKVDPVGPLQGIHSSIEYTVEIPKAGAYTLSARVVTSNVDQSLQLAVNGEESPITIELPFTIGRWEESKPVTLNLKAGKNTLHFWRDRAPQFGVALKSFTLKPPAP